MPALDDESLARTAIVDPRAFAELYRRYRHRVYRYIRSRAPDRPTAEDLTAHVFLGPLSSAASFRGDGSYRSWIFRIAENTLSSWRARRRWAVALDTVREAVDPAPSPLTHVLTHETRAAVRRTVATLPPAQREVVTLYYLAEWTPREIAAAWLAARVRFGSCSIALASGSEKYFSKRTASRPPEGSGWLLE